MASDLPQLILLLEKEKKLGLEPQGLAKNGLRPMKRERNRKPRKNASAFDEIALDGINAGNFVIHKVNKFGWYVRTGT